MAGPGPDVPVRFRDNAVDGGIGQAVLFGVASQDLSTGVHVIEASGGTGPNGAVGSLFEADDIVCPFVRGDCAVGRYGSQAAATGADPDGSVRTLFHRINHIASKLAGPVVGEAGRLQGVECHYIEPAAAGSGNHPAVTREMYGIYRP